MFISPGELQRGQWIMFHSAKERERSFQTDAQQEAVQALGMVLMNHSEPCIPHMVLSVQIPFVAVADCTQQPCASKVWRTDEKNFVEVNEDFVKSLDTLAWHRGKKLLDPTYQIPMPSMPPGQSGFNLLLDLMNQSYNSNQKPPRSPKPPKPPKSPPQNP